MTERHYYEFAAIDRPLTEREMGALRASSARAVITPTRYVDQLRSGDFRGDADVWMERYFDAFLHRTSWGVRVLQLRLPAARLGLGAARRYCPGESAVVQKKGAHIVLRLASEDDSGDDDDCTVQLDALIGVREELAAGDLRALYLAWLACVQCGELEDTVVEPPVPAGLRDLSPALATLAEFLRLERGLLAAASAVSPAPAPLRDADVTAWVRKLAVKDKDTLLARLMTSDPALLRAELVRRFREAHPDAPAPMTSARTVGALLTSAEDHARRAARTTLPAARSG